MRIRTLLWGSYLVVVLAALGLMAVLLKAALEDVGEANLQAGEEAVQGVVQANYQISEKVLSQLGEVVVELKALSLARELSLMLAGRELERQNEILEIKVAERTMELALTQDVTIHSLASLAETRDNETGGHILRTQRYVKTLAKKLASNPKYAEALDARTIQLFYKCAPLHDIGKVGVPDAILQKPGKLTDQEFAIMRTHCELGYQALLKAEQLLAAESQLSFLSQAMDIAYTHHEKFNGTGYPRGLAGQDIPLSGRIMAVADVYDALICKRVYKPPFTHEKAVAIISGDAGTHFCPDVVAAFLEVREEFRRIALELADHEEERQALAK